MRALELFEAVPELTGHSNRRALYTFGKHLISKLKKTSATYRWENFNASSLYSSQMKLLNFSQKAIEYLFYALFFLVPLVFLGSTSELFELNKIWLTYGISILIALFWGIKIIANKQFRIQRTPLDIPILLFLLANILSTIFSWDPYVSFWGYYSRFNGGLLSIATYIFLYYAFASNLLTNKTGGASDVIPTARSSFGSERETRTSTDGKSERQDPRKNSMRSVLEEFNFQF